MTIICSGSIAFDYLMSFPGRFRDHIIAGHVDSISLSFLVDSLIRQKGGTAPNIAYTLALLGGKPSILGTAGEDFAEYRDWLESHGVETSQVKVIPETFTASFFANTDRDNNQISSFYTGAMAHAGTLSLKDLPARPELVIVSPNDPAAMDRNTQECRELGIPFLYDPGQQVVRVSGEEIARGMQGAASLFVNEYEYELLQKHTGLTPAQILDQVGFLVVTLGKQGADIYAGGKRYHVIAVEPREILDPTGVGDAFRAGFVRGRSLGLDWETCGNMGSLAAAYCLETRGPQEHHFTPKEFVLRYREHFDDQGKLDLLTVNS